MKKFVSYFTIVLFVFCLFAVPAMAKNHQGHGTSGSQGVGHNGPGNQGNDKPVGNTGGGCDNPCCGPDCSGSGNFDISTFAAGGGVDCDFQMIPNGFAGGIGAAGGLSAGQATGEIVSFGRFSFGEAGAELESIAGGFANTESYIMHDCGLFIGVGSITDTYATTQGSLHVDATGLGYSAGEIHGCAGQGSLNGSLIGPSPLPMWDSEGFSGGLAGQGSIGGFEGGAIAAGYGSADVEAGIEMFGGSYSESYRGINFSEGFKTEYMGTNVGAQTTVNSYGSVDDHCLAVGCLDGGFEAGGFAGALTVQKTDSGIAKASACGSYSGGGELGCNFAGSAIGHTQTSATTLNGYNGSVMSSSSSMNVSVSASGN